MNDINRVYLVGRLTADPEMKQPTRGTSFCSFSLANNRTYTRGTGESVDEVSFLQCVLWGKAGEAFMRIGAKGKQVAIEGRLRQRRWESGDGKTQSAVEIIVENFQFMGNESRRDDGPPAGYDEIPY